MVDGTRNSCTNNVVFVKQFVQDVIGFSSHYGSDLSVSYTAYNITGKPSKYPEYGDFPQAFVMRTYGKWWHESPSKTIPIMPQSMGKLDSQDYIDLEFEESVYPYRVNIYEIYNPGSVVRIWAADCNEKWKLLWEGEPQYVGHNPRIFSPHIRTIDFCTRLLRLEFYHLHLDYYTELDAVLLIGTKAPIVSSRCRNEKLQAIGNLTSQIMELNIHNIPPQVNISNTISNFLGGSFQQYLLDANSIDKMSFSSRENGSVSGRGFDSLPDETVLKIFGFLDLLSLCRCAQVCKYFYNLATDSLLYTELNLKVYWYCTTPETLRSLGERCQYLQKLDLSWCGSMHVLKSTHFINFINLCGSQLTHLRLNSCKFVDNICMLHISRVCTNLKELSLRNCTNITEYGFHYLTFLNGLQYLDLYRTMIQLVPLQKILMCSPHLHHINIGSCVHISNMDEVAFTMASHNPELISADFWKSASLTPVGVKALAQCKNLEELDLGWCHSFGAPGDSLVALAHGCPQMKKLFLAALRGLADKDLEPFIELCPNIEQLDLLGVRSISSDICISFLTHCSQLKLLDVSFCDQILDSQVTYWRRLFPNVSIKRSFQRSADSFTPTHH